MSPATPCQSRFHRLSIDNILFTANFPGIADYAANPVKKRPDYPEMPPQAHLDDATRLAAAEFMLKLTK